MDGLLSLHLKLKFLNFKIIIIIKYHYTDRRHNLVSALNNKLKTLIVGKNISVDLFFNRQTENFICLAINSF